MAISPNRIHTVSPDSDSHGDKTNSMKATIVREVEAAVSGQLERYGDDGLRQWHAHLQSQLTEASQAHMQAKEWLKQVQHRRYCPCTVYVAEKRTSLLCTLQ